MGVLPEGSVQLNLVYSFCCVLAGYFCGCLSTGYLVGKLYHIDIQHEGSGNVGATNALRTTGMKGGIITLLGDILKAFIPALLVKYWLFAGFSGREAGWFSTEYYVLLTGLATVLGHNFPFWMHFKGGKGISSTGGVLLVFHLPLAGILLLILFAVVAVTKYVSLGSIIAVVGIPIGIAICYPGKWALVGIGTVFAVLALIRHRPNIRRLMQGNENKLGSHKKP